jgi:hypothetical protein
MPGFSKAGCAAPPPDRFTGRVMGPGISQRKIQMDLTTLLAALAATPLAGAVPYVTAAIAAASVLDAALPQPKAGSLWLPLRKVISLLAGNVGHAANAEQTPKGPAASPPSPSALGIAFVLAGLAGTVAACSPAELATAVSDVDKGVAIACADYAAARPAVAIIAAATPAIASLESYGDSICAQPTPTTDAGTAAWVGQITGQLLTLAAR